MLQEAEGDEWIYRRNGVIRGPLEELVTVIAGIPCLRIDLQLLYKSKDPRPKDEQDLERALIHMNETQRATLASWLRLIDPAGGHPWLRRLAT